MNAPLPITQATLDAAVEAACRSGSKDPASSELGMWDWHDMDDEDREYWRRVARRMLTAAMPVLAAAIGQQATRRECTALCDDIEQDRDEWEARARKAEAAIEQARADERERCAAQLLAEIEQRYLGEDDTLRVVRLALRAAACRLAGKSATGMA